MEKLRVLVENLGFSENDNAADHHDFDTMVGINKEETQKL